MSKNTQASSWNDWYDRAMESLPAEASAGEAIKIGEGLKKLLLDNQVVTSVSEMNN